LRISGSDDGPLFVFFDFLKNLFSFQKKKVMMALFSKTIPGCMRGTRTTGGVEEGGAQRWEERRT
jgi:hypothetical protein